MLIASGQVEIAGHIFLYLSDDLRGVSVRQPVGPLGALIAAMISSCSSSLTAVENRRCLSGQEIGPAQENGSVGPAAGLVSQHGPSAVMYI